MKILVVEDEVKLNDALCAMLKSNGYEVVSAYDGKTGMRDALSDEFDCILLDIMLPQINGLKVLKKIRENENKTPVILLTARNDIDDKITGLDLGADDYIQKPFNTDELMARIRTVLRRSGRENPDNCDIEFGDVVLQTSTKKLSSSFGEVGLADKECDLMKCFIRNSTTVISPDKLAESAWGSQCSDAIDTYVEFIRHKLKLLKSSIQIFKINGLGYKICPKE